MSFNPYEFDRDLAPDGRTGTYVESLGQYTAKTFLWMLLGLLVTFAVAIVCWMTDITYYVLIYHNYLMMVALVATLILSVTMSSRIEKMAVGTAISMFMAFSAIFGFTISMYLYYYQFTSVIFVFLATAVYFGALAAYGYFTHKDLAGIRPILISGVLFLIAFWVITMFIPSFNRFDQIVCIIGIAVFLGYTAYDTQKIKAYYNYYAGYPDMLTKASIFSALQLYLDFINLFLYLLRFLGKSRK